MCVIVETYSSCELSGDESRASSMERRGSAATPFGEEVWLMIGERMGGVKEIRGPERKGRERNCWFASTRVKFRSLFLKTFYIPLQAYDHILLFSYFLLVQYHCLTFCPSSRRSHFTSHQFFSHTLISPLVIFILRYINLPCTVSYMWCFYYLIV